MPFVPDAPLSPTQSGRFVPDVADPQAEPKPKGALDTALETAGDLGVSFGAGANSLLEGAGTLYGLATGDMDNWARERGEAGREYWEAKKSADLKAAEADRRTKIDAADGELAKAGTAFWETLKDPRLLSAFTAEQIPMFLPVGMAGRAGQAASLSTGAAGKVAQVAEKTATSIGSGNVAARLAQKGLAGLSTAPKVAGAIGTGTAVGAGAALQGADVGGDAYDDLLKLPDALWEHNLDFQELRGELGDAEAKKAVARSLARQSGAEGGAASVLTNLLPWARTFERAAAKAPGLSGNAVARGVKGGMGEMAQEASEEGLGRVSVNRAASEVDPSRPVSQGVGEAAGLGAIGAGPIGAAAGVVSGPEQADSPGPTNEPIQAAEVTGTPPSAGAGGGFKPDEAEADPLLTPRNLTALDRVAEIEAEDARLQARDAELAPANGYGQAFDKERQDIAARRAELYQERQGIMRSWPDSIHGKPATFSTETGAILEGRYALMEAGSLVASHDENLRANPVYPPELQPRQRERAASEMQIAGIVQKLDPARLGESADVANGAPIVGEDGLVESGNARTIALKRVYQANGLKADTYRQFLRDNADRYGLQVDDVDAMEKPVLVRVRTTPVNRAEFARQANASTVAQMSPSEQAKSDAERIDSLDDLNPDESGEFMSGSSRDFVRRFMARVPGTEQAGMIDATGQLSQAGYTRLRNAVLAKAYGDSPVLLRMVESLDDETRNLSKALMQVAPQVAKTRQLIKDGALHDADITPPLMEAVEAMAAIKGKGGSVWDALAQRGMFGDQYSPEARALIQFLADNQRRPRRIAEFIQQYMDILQAAGHPAQGSLLGETTAPAVTDLMTATRRKIDGQATVATETAAGQSASARQEGGREPGDAAGGKPGTTGDAEKRADAERRLKEALADMGTIARDLAGVQRMLPEETPKLLETLTKLFQAAFDLGYYDMKRATAWVREQLRKDPESKPIANFIKNDTMQKAAQAALAAPKPAAANGPIDMVDRMQAKADDAPQRGFEFGAGQVDRAAHAAATSPTNGKPEPTDAQKKAGNYEKGHVRVAGLDISVENPAGSERSGTDPNGKPWSVTMASHYGYLKGTVGKDKDHLDVFIKPGTPSDYTGPVFVVDQKKPGNGHFDEHKIMLGYASQDKAKRGYLANYTPGWNGIMAVTPFAMADFKAWLADGDHTRPASDGKAAANGVPATWTLSADGREYTDEHGFVRGFAMSDGERAVEQAFYDRIRTDLDGLIDQYLSLVLKPKDGKLVDPDKIKELSDEFKADRSLAHAVHEPSSHLSKVIFERLVRENIDTPAVFTAGGGGSGKSEAMPIAQKVAGLSAEGVVFDSTLSAFGSAKKKIDKVLSFGGRVTVVYTNSPVTKAFEFAMQRERVVPIRVLSHAHKGASDTIREVVKHYDGNPAVRVIIVNNFGSIEDFHVGTLTDVPVYEYNEVVKTLLEIAQEARNDGRIDDEKFGKLAAGIQGEGSASDVRPEPVPVREAGGLGNADDGRGIQAVRGEAGRNQGSPGGGRGTVNDDRGTGNVSLEGEGAGPAQAIGSKRETQRVRAGSGSGYLFGSGQPDASATAAGEVGRPGADGMRRQDEDGGRAKPRGGAGRSAGVPAGRDIPLKSGRNYAFGDTDLTYEGGWLKKAVQNVEAVELLKKLRDEDRQATREEQAILAKFIGWGSSEIANTLFGDKLDKQLEAKSSYETAAEAMERHGKGFLSQRDSGFYPAFLAVYGRDNGKVSYYQVDRITSEQLAKAKPDGSVGKWADLRDRLKAALTTDEWKDASRSTQYAHYTSKGVVRAMWKAVDRMGFKGGAILEPGAGIGVFPGLMSSEVATNSAYTGIEFDPITGGILKQLFPDERILVESFVDSSLPGNFYDVAIGNPPFGSIPILADPKYKKLAFPLHDYFFAKTMDSVKPGGLVMFVTSRYTMDKVDDKARAYLAERADMIGAIRLPQTAFQKNAGTEVVTDVLFLRKKVPGETFAHGQGWSGLKEIKAGNEAFMVNEYFVDHPEMVLGEHSSQGSMYAKNEYTVTPRAGDIEAQFAAAVERLPKDVYHAARGSAAEAAKVREIDFNPKAQKEGNYYVTDAGVLMQREGGVGQRVELKSEKDLAMLRDFVGVRDALKQAHYDQLNDGDWAKSLANLQKAYRAFVKKHGQINQFTTYMQKVKVDELDENGDPTGQKVWDEEERRRFPLLSKMQDDPDYTLVAALEVLNGETGKITESTFLTERVLGKPATQEVKTPSDALLAVLNDTGAVDIGAIADRLGIDEGATIEALGSLVYQDPAAGWQMADEYLSGNVKKKLQEAQAAAKTDRRFERNVEALLSVQPAPVPPSDIAAKIGMNWIPAEVYERFIRELAGVQVRVNYNDHTGQWSVSKISGYHTTQATVDWGTSNRDAADILESALTSAPIRVTRTEGSGQDKRVVFDQDATEAANQKRQAMREAFGNWLWQDGERTDKLVKLYNDTFNTIVPRKFDGRHLTLPGTSKRWSVFDHVKRGAWRIIQAGNTYLGHAVGSGKTFQMVISSMEQKRLGLIKKPMAVVPNHMLQQFAREWQDLYPAARLMVADERNFHTENRRRFVSRVAMSDLDGVIITHSAFKLLDLDPEFKRKMIEQELDYLRAALSEVEDAEGDGSDRGGRKSPKVKQIENRIEKMEQKLAEAMSGAGKDKNVRFDELGVDMLYVDEAHEYRKLAFTTQRQVKGIDSSGSDRAFDLWMKTRWLEQKKPGRSLVMASGTPVTNTLAELYSVQRFMANSVLEERGIDNFDDWASMFGEENTEIEADASGRYAPVTRFTKFVNVPELTQMFREFADVLTSEHLAAMLGDKRPKVAGGSRKLMVTEQTDEYRAYKEDLAHRLTVSRAWKPSRDEPFNPDPIIKIIGDGRLAAIDMRFVDPSLPSNPESKLNRLVDEVIRVYKETAGWEYTDKEGRTEPTKGAAQMVFSDLGFGAGVAANRGFNARAWVEKRLRDAGVPPAHIAFMSDFKKSTDKLKLFKDVNAGRVRILIGSSKNMGTGVNAQQRLIALHHLDTPWYPADLEQREGRIIRQGNKNPLVQVYAFSTKGSYDAVMWQMLASKQRFIDQALSGDSSVRSIDDMSESSQYQIATAMTADDPRAMQLAGLRAEIEKLQRLYRAHEEQRARMRQSYNLAGEGIQFNEKRLPDAEKAAAMVENLAGDKFRAKVGGKVLDSRKEWGEAVLTAYKALADKLTEGKQQIGEISGFKVMFSGGMASGVYLNHVFMPMPDDLNVRLAETALADPTGLAMRATNALAALERRPAELRSAIAEYKAKREALAPRLDAKFEFSPLLAEKTKEAADLEAAMLADQAKPEGEQQQEPVQGETKLSRGAGGGMAMRDLKAVVSRVKRGMANLPPVNVLASPRDLDRNDDTQRRLYDYIEKHGALDIAEGATHEGEIYMFSDNLAGELRAEHVLAVHETTHYGLRAVFGADLDPVLQAIWANNAKVRKAAAELRQKDGLASNVGAVEEVLADMEPSALAKLKGWRRLVQFVRDWLNAHGFTAMAGRMDALLKSGLADQEKADLIVADVITRAREWVRNGKTGRLGNVVDTKLAENRRLADDLAEQEKWLNTEARARGFKDIDDLAAKDYPVFEKLAARWRERHPADVMLSRAVQDESGVTAIPGKGLIKDKFLAIVDGEYAPGGPWETEGAAIKAGEAWKLLQIDQARQKTQERERWDHLADKLRAGQRPTDNEIQMIGLRLPASDVRWFFPVAAQLFGVSSRSIRMKVASMIRVGFTDMGVKREFVPTIDALLAVADQGIRLSRAGNAALSGVRNLQTASVRADDIIAKRVGAFKPIDVAMKGVTKALRVDRGTGWLYDKAGFFLDRFTPETVKAGVVADYGIPEAVIDQRAMMHGRMRVQLRKTGELIDKLATLTRAESRVAYQWMNSDDPQSSDYFMAQLPPESIQTMAEVERMIDHLSKEAVALGQLDPESFKRNRFAYLRRSYVKHTAELTKGEARGRARTISILGDQYKGRGMTDGVEMRKVRNIAPEWWRRKFQAGKADNGLKGEKFVRLERRANTGAGTAPLAGMTGRPAGRLLEVAYWPAGEPVPASLKGWEEAGSWEVRGTKGDKLIMWRDFTAQEREAMGEIDEARFAIAKTLHGMIHDVETGRYLEWLAQRYAKKDGAGLNVVEASERMRHTFAQDEWVQVPESTIPGTSVRRYGLLAGRYLPGPIWNDVRQVAGVRYKPMGDTYAAILSAWKTSKTTLSPAVHTNNVMANMVMADWHDVSAGHVLKALRLMLGASERGGRGVLGRTGNLASRAGHGDAEAAREILNRFQDSGGNIGTWATAELRTEQLEPLLAALEKEVTQAGQVPGSQVGVMAALQHALRLRFPSAWDAFKPTLAGKMLTTEAKNMIALYEAEDQVFRLAAWLKAKEDGLGDLEAGKVARKSFLDYNINAPWIQVMRQTAFPFIAFTYRAVPMLLETAAKKPWKLMKLGLVAGVVNALGYTLSGGDEDEERRLLPEEKAGSIWGVVPKLLRMPWNDAHDAPVFLDVRRWVPVGDVFDLGQNHAAVPMLPFAMPSGPVALFAEIVANKSQFTGRPIVQATDTAAEQTKKVADHLYKAFAPNLIVLPGTYAFTGALNAGAGKTDAFGREQSLAQSVASAHGVKLGSYPRDVLLLNASRKMQAELMEIQRNVSVLKRERMRNGIDQAEFEQKVSVEMEKRRRVLEDMRERVE